MSNGKRFLTGDKFHFKIGSVKSKKENYGLGTTEVAKILSKSRQTVINMYKRGLLKGVIFHYSNNQYMIRFNKDEVLKLAAELERKRKAKEFLAAAFIKAKAIEEGK